MWLIQKILIKIWESIWFTECKKVCLYRRKYWNCVDFGILLIYMTFDLKISKFDIFFD